MDEEDKSKKNVEDNPSSHVDGGSQVAEFDNSTKEVDGEYKYTADDIRLLNKYFASTTDEDKAKYLEQINAAGFEQRVSISILARPSPEAVAKYKEQENAGGFDVDYSRELHVTRCYGIIVPMLSEYLESQMKHLECFMGLVAEAHKKEHGDVLQDMKIVKANQQLIGRVRYYYITFSANCSLDGQARRFYQTKVSTDFDSHQVLLVQRRM